MFFDRGYTNILTGDINKGKYSLYALKPDGTPVVSFICEENKLNIQGIKDRLSILKNNNIRHCLIVYKNIITSSAKKILEVILDYEIELFSDMELQVNITKHSFQPKFELASEEEKDYLDEHYKNKLPVILTTDPISKYYNYKRGQYVRITRKNNNIIYRLVK